MAVQTTYVVGGAGKVLSNNDTGKAFRQKFSIDASNVNVANGDVLKLMNIPKDVYILDVVVEVITAEGATQTMTVGDYLIATDAEVDLDGYLVAVNGNSVAVSKTRDQLAEDTTAVAYAAGKLYTDALAYLGVLFNHAADAVVFDVTVIGYDFNQQ